MRNLQFYVSGKRSIGSDNGSVLHKQKAITSHNDDMLWNGSLGKTSMEFYLKHSFNAWKLIWKCQFIEWQQFCLHLNVSKWISLSPGTNEFNMQHSKCKSFTSLHLFS